MGEIEEQRTKKGLLRPLAAEERAPCVGPVRLVVVTGADCGRRYLVSADATIGRSSKCTIHITNELVSRVHARLRRDPEGRLLIEDCSRNKTLVNGRPVERTALFFGDTIQVGNETVLALERPDPMELQALDQGRMQAIGYLSAGIAHDLNNLLGATITSLDYLRGLDRETKLSDAQVAECLADIQGATKRSADLVARVLLFGRQSKDTYEPCDASTICEDVIVVIRRSFERKIEVVSELEPGLQVSGDRSQLVQLMLSLCINARDAMPSGGTLTIETSETMRDDVSYVLFSVANTGVGMDGETRGRIFEQLPEPKLSGSGTGLGLATVFEVTKWHGGIVEVESEPGRGATFRVWLPSCGRAEQRALLDGLETLLPEAPGALGGFVLVVDDNEMLRRSTSRLLRQAGHEILTASNGAQAIAMYTEGSRRPELVLLDLDMPGMDGLETFRALKAVDPQVNVLFVSGYPSEDWAERLEAQGAFGFLHKPVAGAQLRARVAAALAR